MAAAPGICGIGPCLPRAVQVVSGGERRALLGRCPRYVERNPQRENLVLRAMTMVEFMATLSWHGRRAVVVGDMANRRATGLARAGQLRRRGRRTGITSSERAPRPPVRPAGVAEGNCETIGPGIDISDDRSPAKHWPQSICRPCP